MSTPSYSMKLLYVRISDWIVAAYEDGWFLRVTPTQWFKKKSSIYRFPAKTWGSSALDREVVDMIITRKVELPQLDDLSREQIEASLEKRSR